MNVSNQDLNDRLCSIQSDLRNFAKTFENLTSIVCDQSRKINAVYGWLNQLTAGNGLLGEAESASDVLSFLSAPSETEFPLKHDDTSSTLVKSEQPAIQGNARKSAVRITIPSRNIQRESEISSDSELITGSRGKEAHVPRIRFHSAEYATTENRENGLFEKMAVQAKTMQQKTKHLPKTSTAEVTDSEPEVFPEDMTHTSDKITSNAANLTPNLQDSRDQDKGFSLDNETSLRGDKSARVSGNATKDGKRISLVRSPSPIFKECGADSDKLVSCRRSSSKPRSISSDSDREEASKDAVVVVQNCSATKKENHNETGDVGGSKALVVRDDKHTRATNSPAAGDGNIQVTDTENMKLESTKESGILEQKTSESKLKTRQASVKQDEKENNLVKSTADVAELDGNKQEDANSKQDFPNKRVYSCTPLGSLVNSMEEGKIPVTMERQHSNSSTQSAPGGLNIKLGGSDSEDDDNQEIQIAEMPTPSFIHRTVQIKQTNSKYFYDLKDPIGGGRFGRVYRCVEKKTGLVLAAKCFKCKKTSETSRLKARSLKVPINFSSKRTQQEPVDKEDVRNEISIMNNIDHVNIVKLYDAFEYENTMTLFLEYMDGGELFERVLADQSELTEFEAILYMRQISKAMQYLHKNLILHLDLKPENILCLDRTSHHIKIIDFGLARKYNPRQKLMIHWGTPEFIAPEALNYDVVSAASDMWSVGVICYILLSGVSPFLGESDKETIENIIEGEWEFEEDSFCIVSDEAKDFISRLLVEEKSGRMSAAQCLRHEWLATPLTNQRRQRLESKHHLKRFMARMHWKAGLAAITAVNWLFSKNMKVSKPMFHDGTSVDL